MKYPMNNRERCDHCGKWVLQGDLVMPNTHEKYQDGQYAICPKCANNKKYDRKYWETWRKKRK
jgi:hypothetical protein